MSYFHTIKFLESIMQRLEPGVETVPVLPFPYDRARGSLEILAVFIGDSARILFVALLAALVVVGVTLFKEQYNTFSA